MVASYKKKHNLKTLLVGVLTDFSPHSFWINEGVDYYIVPSIEARERFISKGVDPDSIKVYGIPIQSKFSVQLDREPIARQLGFDPEVPTILVMGGGQGLGPIKNVIKSLMKVEMNIQVVVLAGTNKKIVSSLRNKVKKSDKKILILEYTKNVDELMDLATLIITKPGGMTTAESLTKGLPMVIIDPIPGQEMRNTDFLINKGIGIRIDSTRDIGEEIEMLLRSPGKIFDMSKAAYEHGKPHATLDIAKLILDHTES
jgi:processive 1,2-diacylglycerol beta-glucosyltransferase